MHLTHTLSSVFPSEPVDGFYRKKQKRTPNLPCAGCGLSDLVPWRYGSVFRSRHIGEFRIRSSKKQKTTNQWRCGPTSISGSVLLCPVLFCELKPFYRSQWPFSCGSHAPFSDESSSADMFSSKQYLLSRSDGRTAVPQIPWNSTQTGQACLRESIYHIL